MSLINEMMNIGLVIDNPVLDGKIHRCPVADKRGRQNGWYTGIEISGKQYCTFGRWDTGEKIKWSDNGHQQLSDTDRKLIAKLSEQIRHETEQKQKRAADSAFKMWGKAIPGAHPYLAAKQIKPHDSRVLNGILLIPIWKDGRIVNLQRIFADGTKKYLYGGEIKGCAYIFWGDTDIICICEGWATGASIYTSTGKTTIVCFQANNLPEIAKQLQSKFPDSQYLFCADNDKSGTGLKYAQIASEIVKSEIRIPPDVGTDFNDMMCQIGLQAVNQAILNNLSITIPNDEISDSMSLNIPAEIYNIAGLISDGMEAALAGGSPDIPQYNLPVVFSIIARAIAGKLCCRDVYPSFYNIKIGSTSTGKTDVDRLFKLAVSRSGIENFYGATDFSSGPGLQRSMSDAVCGQALLVLDEVTYLFKRSKDDILGAGKMAALLELYTCAGTDINKAYGDSKKSVHIKNPCLILTGNATTAIFDEIKQEDMISGVLQRFDFWHYDGEIPYRKLPSETNPAMDRFIAGVIQIFQSIPPLKHAHDIQSLIGNWQMPLSRQAEKLLNEYSKSNTDAANNAKCEGDGVQGIIMRQFHLSIKYAMLHAASVRPAGNLYAPLQLTDLEYGIKVAEMLCGWKRKHLADKITSSEFHKDCETFKDAIRAAMQSKLKPSENVLCNRKKRLKGLKPVEMQAIIQALLNRNEIYIDNSGRKPMYYLCVENKG